MGRGGSQLSTHDCLQTTGLGNSFGPMKFNDSHVKQTSLHFVGNANHMKVASNSVGPCDCHVT